MKTVMAWVLGISLVLSFPASAEKKTVSAAGLYALTATDISGKPAPLSKFAGKVALVVNTASRCGFTSQYEGLQRLQQKFESQGFVVLGFPSNDFFAQEPGTNEEIKIFCEKNYRVSFPLFSKEHVKGDAKQPIYRFLTESSPEAFRGEVSWNFEKFLIDRQGNIVSRFKPRVSPESDEVLQKIAETLAKK